MITTKPRKSGSELVTHARVSSGADQWLDVRVVIRHHRRLLPDEEIASWDDRVQVGKGTSFTHELSGPCKRGKHQYFAKITARSKSFSEPAEYSSERAEITC